MALSARLYNRQYRLRQSLDAALWKLLRGRSPATAGNIIPGRVLFILSGLIGDSIMCMPTIREARRIWPDAHITILGKPHNRELLKASTFYDEFYECNADPYSVRKAREIKELSAWLVRENFDTAVILLGDQFAKMLANAGIPVRIGVRGSLLEPFLTQTYPIGLPEEWGPEDRLNALRAIGYETGRPDIRLDVSAEDREVALKRLHGQEVEARFLLVHPFSSSEVKHWDLNRIGPLSETVEREMGLRTVVVGGKAEAGLVGTVDLGSAVDMTGQFSLAEFIGLIDAAAAVVTTDSGPFHIAAARNRPVVGLFRERAPAHSRTYSDITALIGRNKICEVECDAYKCSSMPCRQMQDLSLARVFDSVRKIAA